MKIENILYFYGLVCIFMILFNIFNIFVSKQSVKYIDSASKRYHKRIQKYADKNMSKNKADKKIVKKIKRELSNTVKMKTFDIFLDQLSKKEKIECRNFIHNNFEIVEELVQGYLKKDPVKAAYFLHVLYKHNICSLRPNDNILNGLKSYLYVNGIYCRHNAMMVLYKAGVPEKIVESLKILNQMDISVHERIVSVGLRHYTGDIDLLIKLLLKEFDGFQVWIQEAICNFIIASGESYQKEILTILNNPEYDQKIHLLCIRYMEMYPYKMAYHLLLSIVENKDANWQYKMGAINALGNYPSEQTVNILKRMLHSPNWNIRSSAAKSLAKQKLTYYELTDVFNGNDRYAREIMQYFLEERKLEEV